MTHISFFFDYFTKESFLFAKLPMDKNHDLHTHFCYEIHCWFFLSKDLGQGTVSIVWHLKTSLLISSSSKHSLEMCYCSFCLSVRDPVRKRKGEILAGGAYQIVGEMDMSQRVTEQKFIISSINRRKQFNQGRWERLWQSSWVMKEEKTLGKSCL